MLFFGNSLTAGYGLANIKTEAFPALIQKKLNEEHFGYDVVNAGVSGDTSAGGLARVDYWLNLPVDIFVLELGINDALRGISPAATERNLQSIIDKVKTKYPGVRLVLMGMELPSFIPGAHAAAFRGIFKALAGRNGMAYVPFFLEGVAGQAHLNLRDGLHPSAEGYKVIVEKVWPVIRSVI